MQQMKRMYDKDGNSFNHLSLWTNEWKMKSKLTSIPWSVIWSEKQIEVISEWSFSFQEKKKKDHMMMKRRWIYTPTYPKMTAFHSIILLSTGAPLIPAGGSCCNLLKSLISLFLEGVDILLPCYNWIQWTRKSKNILVSSTC